MNIQVLAIRFLHGDRSTKAFADVKIDDMIVSDFRVMQNEGRAYVRTPFSTYKNQTGELCFKQIVTFPDEVRGQIDNLILSAFYREREKSNAADTNDS
jgi:DNA-binding cell septation regulator SpoVG